MYARHSVDELIVKNSNSHQKNYTTWVINHFLRAPIKSSYGLCTSQILGKCCRGSRATCRGYRGTTRGSWRPHVCGSRGTRRAVAWSRGRPRVGKTLSVACAKTRAPFWRRRGCAFSCRCYCPTRRTRSGWPAETGRTACARRPCAPPPAAPCPRFAQAGRWPRTCRRPCRHHTRDHGPNLWPTLTRLNFPGARK